MKSCFLQRVYVGISLVGIFAAHSLRAENNLPPSIFEIQRNQAATQAIIDKWNLPPARTAPTYRPPVNPPASTFQAQIAEIQRNQAATQAILDKWDREEKAESLMPVKRDRVDALNRSIDRLISSVTPLTR